jgi:hypothetical protein
MFFEHLRSGLGVLAEGFPVGRRHGGNKSIDVSHGISPVNTRTKHSAQAAHRC